MSNEFNLNTGRRKVVIKHYLKKRKQVMDIIESVSFNIETKECRHSVAVDCWASRKMAESILIKFGLQRPPELNSIESEGYMINKLPPHD